MDGVRGRTVRDTDGWMDGWMGGWVDGDSYGWIDGQIDRYGQMDGRESRKDGWECG